MKKLLVALAIVLLVACSVNSPDSAYNGPRDQWYAESTCTETETGTCIPHEWLSRPMVSGFGTTYDAFDHAGSWYDDKGGTWLWVDPSNRKLTKASCKANPEWKCYQHPNGKLVRPWKSTLNDMYAALGPWLRQRIASQIPRWHALPTHKVLVTSVHSGKSVVVWVADFCLCYGRDHKQNTKDDSLIDLSPQVWAKLGAFRNGKNGQRISGWKNTIEVRFIP